MLKKRILASSLASVMALSSVSVVAFADETATADANASVNKAELKEYVASFEKFIEGDIEDYGTTQSEQFFEAYDHAKGVSEDSNATDEEATAAYQMLKAVRANMNLYTKEQLKELLDDYKADYDTENERDANVEGDKIWKQDTFDTFAIAYADAENCVEYDNGRDITNLYVDLKNAHDKLVKDKLETVNKTQFRAVQREYEAIISSLEKYEDWRRGVCTVKATTGDPKKADGTALDLTKAVIVTFGDLKTIVTGTSAIDTLKDKDGKTLALDVAGGKQWIKNTVSVDTDFKNASIKFDAIEKSNITSDTSIVDAYNSAKEAVAVFKGWKADSTNFARKENVDSLIKEYHDKYVKEYMKATTFFAGNDIAAIINDDFTVKSKAEIEAVATYAVNQSGEVTKSGAVLKLRLKDNKFVAGATYSDTGANSDLVIKPGMNLISYVQVISAVATASNGATTVGQNGAPAVKAALELYEAYKTEAGQTTPAYETNCRTAFDALQVGGIALDQNKTIKTLTGSSAEYTLICRALRYAFEDALPTAKAADNYKISQLESLIAKCYDAAEDIGDFAKFKNEYNELVEARKGALEFVREAKALSKKEGKNYKDGETAVEFTLTYNIGTTGDKAIAAGAKTAGDKVNTTAVYKALAQVHKMVTDAYAKYPVSFGDIAELIADVAEGVDSDAYGAGTATVETALADLALKLSTLKVEDEDNQPFTSDRALNKYNRLLVVEKPKTDDEKASKPVYESYQALLKAVEEATATPEVVKGDLTGDGVATPEDAIMIVKAFVGEITLTDAQKAAADFNGDGVVNADDALAVVKAYVGL